MDSFCSLFNGMIHFRFSGLTSAGQTGMCCSALSFGNKPLIHSGTCITRQGDGSFVLLVSGGIRIPFAQWSPETLGAGSVLPFALTNSPHFRLRRTAHRADIRLLCHSLRSYGSDPCLAQTNRKSSPQERAFLLYLFLYSV